MSESNWIRASARHLKLDGEPASIVKVDSKQQIRYEMYCAGRYLGWRESAQEAKCAIVSSIAESRQSAATTQQADT